MGAVHRFYLPATKLQIGQPVDLTPLVHQLGRVLRLSPGACVALFNGDGMDYMVEVTHLERRSAAGLVHASEPGATEPQPPLTLYQCSLKADKFEWVLQKGTELGVARFVPVISARSIVRPAAALIKKYDRWQTIIREAAEQSGRTQVPTLGDPLPLDDAIAVAQGIRLLPFEDLGRDSPAPTLLQAVADAGDAPDVEAQLSLLIGPEGGFDANEIVQAQAAGWQIVSLGPRILRAETAAIAATALLTLRSP